MPARVGACRAAGRVETPGGPATGGHPLLFCEVNFVLIIIYTMDPQDRSTATTGQAKGQPKGMVEAMAARADERSGQKVGGRDDKEGDGRTGPHAARGPCASPPVLAAFMAPSGTACAAPALRFVDNTTHRRVHVGRRALPGAESRGLHGLAEAASDRPMPTMRASGGLDQESGPSVVASRTRGDDGTPMDITGVKRARDAADERDDDAGRTGNNALNARPRRRFAAVTGDVLDDDEGRRFDAGRAERLRRGLAAAAGLPEPGLMLQAMARLQTLYAPEETGALVARAYANVVPSPFVDNDDDDDAVPGPRAPPAFVEWFGLHHAAYGLDDTPDFVWSTKVPPRSPRVEDPWSQAYWLAGNNAKF